MTNKKAQDFRYLIESGYAFENVVAFFMREAGVPMTSIALTAGVARSTVSLVISNKRTSKKVRKAISRVLGFDPWEVANA